MPEYYVEMKKTRKLIHEALDSRQLMAVDFSLLQDIETKPGKTSDFAVLGAVGAEVAFAFTGQDSLRFRDQLWEIPASESGPAHPLHDAGNLGTIGTNGIVELNGRYLFNSGSDLPSEDGLWSTDGTSSGSIRLGPSAVAAPTLAAGKAFYFVHHPEGMSLWVTDGTVAGTRKIIEDRDDQNFHFESPLASDGTQVYMVVRDHLSMRHLATVDSNDRVSTLVAFPAGDTGQVEYLDNGNLLITNRPGLNGPFNEVYGYNPNQGLALLSDEVSGLVGLPTLQISGGRAFFAGDSFSLWSTDGTVAGTDRVLDASYTFSDRPLIAAIGDRMLFAAHHDFGVEFFISDGTTGGTIALGMNAPLHPHYYPVTASDDAFYFIGSDDSNQFQLCRVDASSGLLQVVASIANPGPSTLPDEGKLFANLPAVVDNRVFFADGGVLSEYLPATDKIVRVSPELGTAGTELEFFAQSDQFAWFKAGQTLWQTDGVTAQTRPVVFPSDLFAPEDVYQPQVIDGQLIFDALANSFPGPTEYGRWSVDPQTGEATRLSLSTSRAHSLIADLPSGRFQIRRDGTELGLYQVSADLKSEQLIAAIPEDIVSREITLTRFDDRLIFVTNGELWQTDGTAAGTLRLRTLSNADEVNSDLHINGAGHLLFLTLDRQIYRLDLGSTQPTHLGTLSAMVFRTTTRTAVFCRQLMVLSSWV